MTLEEAVEILNWHQHRGHSRWSLWTPGRRLDQTLVVGPDRHEDALDPFEALAIAERYQRGKTVSTTLAELGLLPNNCKK